MHTALIMSLHYLVKYKYLIWTKCHSLLLLAYPVLAGNLSKPVISDWFESFDLRVFVEDDPRDLLIHEPVWLAAEARALTADDQHWRWIDGRPTSTHARQL